MGKLTLVAMAAGMGSRFGGLKQVQSVGPAGEIILDYSVYDAKSAGFDKVVFIIKKENEHEFREVVSKRIEKIIDVDYAFQEIDSLPSGFKAPNDRTKPWGTGHAVLCAENAIDSPFVVINADDYYGKGAFNVIGKHMLTTDNVASMVGFKLSNTLSENGTVSRGVCTVDENGYLKSIDEKTKIRDCMYTDDEQTWIPLAEDTIVSMNMWGFNRSIFYYLKNDFEEFLNENINIPKKEFYLPSVVDKLIKTHHEKVPVLTTDEKWYGITYKEDLELIQKALKSREL